MYNLSFLLNTHALFLGCYLSFFRAEDNPGVKMQISLRKMLEAGAHFGHQTKYWHPAMSNYIFGHRNKIHIINLEKTLEKFQEALDYIVD